MTYSNILIVKLSAIGDVIHALPVASALKQQFPRACITWVVEKPAYDILTNNPNIDEIIIFDKPRLKSFSGKISYLPSFIRELRNHNFDLAIDLQGLFKSSAIAWLSGASTRLVYCNAREGSHILCRRICGQHASGHVIDRYLDVARYLGCQIEKPNFAITITPQEAARTSAIAAHAGLNLNNPYVILAIGTNWPNKCWPVEYFTTLGDMLYSNNVIPVLIGSAAEQKMAAAVIERAQIPPVDLTGRTSLKELAYIIQKAAAFVGGDTGTMHLAAALQTPVVALFGPTDPKRNGPYGSKHTVLTVSHDCQGCWQRKCSKGQDCLRDIRPEAVFSEIMKKL